MFQTTNQSNIYRVYGNLNCRVYGNSHSPISIGFMGMGIPGSDLMEVRLTIIFGHILGAYPLNHSPLTKGLRGLLSTEN